MLGSATPSLESYFNASYSKYALLELPDRVEQRPLPEVEIIDMRQEFQETGHEQVISRKLAEEIKERLERKEQVMVLLNRRGYSPVVLCRACGKTLECQNCAIAADPSQTFAAHGVPLLRLSRRRFRRPACIAAASTCIFSEPDRRSWKSFFTACFRRRASAGWIATRCAAMRILNARCTH